MTVRGRRALTSAEAAHPDAPMIPMVRLDNGDPELRRAVWRVTAQGAFTLGDEVEAFEREFAQLCGTKHAVGVSSGTEAIALALRALEIGPGDEVVLPTNSFIATAEAVTLTGATPKLADVDVSSGLLTASILERCIGPRTRAVIPVHLYGATVEMEPLLRLARAAELAVIEDACQAHGAHLPGGRAGSLGDCGCFSFYPTKNLGGWGDGGAVITRNSVLAERLRLLRSHGETPEERHRHRLCGTTARLDAIQAAVLRVKLRALEDQNRARRMLAAQLAAAIEGTSIGVPRTPADGDHVFHLYVVESDRREALRAHLAARGIATAVHYPVPIHLTEAYSALGLPHGSLPAAERRADRICSLPFYPAMTPAELDRMIAGLLAFNGRGRHSGTAA